ncbi:MAG: site-specific DNA-methyltransferase [Prevotellaceae bacterium]|jgi:site-specific DNA-methyltransferase (adenine-specific)|nr:site-specific DNA-methyltransferase [Prevotellaceae bacterium]
MNALLNTITQGDCLDLIKQIPDSSIDSIITDPPYLYLKNQKLDRPFDENLFFSEAKRVLKRNGFIVLFGRGTSFYRWNCMLANLGFTFKEEIIWNKSYCSSPLMNISRVHETISIHTRGKGIINKVKIPYLEMKGNDIDGICVDLKRFLSGVKNTKSLNAVLSFLENNKKTLEKERLPCYNITQKITKNVDKSVSIMEAIKYGMNEKSIIKQPRDHYKTIHPTQKPVRLLERLLALVTNVGDLVLDPFSGSGSTALACRNTGRNFVAFEIDKEYYDLSIKSLKKEYQTSFFYEKY